MAKPQPHSAETLRQDVPVVLTFLRLLEAVTPGRSVEETIADLEGLASNTLGLELLAGRANAHPALARVS